MKITTILLLLLLAAQLAAANAIDALKTVEDVQQFLVKKVHKKWKGWTLIAEVPGDTATYGKGRFFKMDINNDGLTDLVVNGMYLMAVTDRGKGRYGIHIIDDGSFMQEAYSLTDIVATGNGPLFVIKEKDLSNYKKTTDTLGRTDTLIFKFGSFVEYNARPEDLQVLRIDFSTTACFGTCPVFELSVDAGGSATYNALQYNDREGKFTGTIEQAAYDKLLQTICYLNLPSLNDDYSVNWTDDQAVTLTVTFGNGQTKTIQDYGAIGTFGLKNLYSQLFALRLTQQWD